MPTTVDVQRLFPGVDSIGFIDLIYKDKLFLHQFHSDANACDDAYISDWLGEEDDMRRELHFSIPSNAPAMIQRFVGAGRISVVEEQRITYSQENGSFTVESVPKPQISMADKFNSKATLTIRNTSDGNTHLSCLVEAHVVCSASVMGLGRTIESFMASEADASLEKFLSYCKTHLDQLNQASLLKDRLRALNSRSAVLATSEPFLAPPTPEEQEEEATVSTTPPGLTVQEPLLAPSTPPETIPTPSTIGTTTTTATATATTMAPTLAVAEVDSGSEPMDGILYQEDSFFEPPEVSIAEVMSAEANIAGLLTCLQYMSKQSEKADGVMVRLLERVVRVEYELQMQRGQQQQLLDILEQQQIAIATQNTTPTAATTANTAVVVSSTATTSPAAPTTSTSSATTKDSNITLSLSWTPLSTREFWTIGLSVTTVIGMGLYYSFGRHQMTSAGSFGSSSWKK